MRVPGYEILGELGRGGMGVVYKARPISAKRLVALKMILAGSHAGSDALERFRTEAEAIARLQHPHIVQIHEVGEHGGLPFFSLEFCAAGSLEKKLQGTPLPPKEAALLLEKLAHGMQAAHEKSVIHRDLKPANVLLNDEGAPKSTDFGLARKLDEAGRTGTVMSTQSYMAPEQAEGKSMELGPACDVYALGAIVYECLTCRPSFRSAMVLTGSGDKTARLWESDTGKPLATLKHDAAVLGIAFSPDSRLVLTGGELTPPRSYGRRQLAGSLQRSNTLVGSRHYPSVREAKREGNWFAVAFHLNKVIALGDSSAETKQRLASAQAQLKK